MTAFASLEDLDFDYQYIEDERVVMTVGVRATFYFWGGHKAATRSALVECIEAYERLYGAELDWAFNADRGTIVAIGAMTPLHSLVQAMDEDDQVEWFAASGDSETATEYHISALTERGWQNGQVSVVSFVVPREHAYVPEKRGALFKLLDLFADRLAPFHGHAGLAAVSTYEQYLYQSDEIDLASRYLGVFIEDIFHSNWAQTGFTSIDWRTFVGNTLAERVGGISALTDQLRAAGIAFSSVPSGVFINAGDDPEIVPVGSEVPRTLAIINAILRPLRSGNVGSMGFGSIDGERRFDRYTSDLWVRRYDVPGVWPPATFIGLPRAPAGAAPRKRVRLETGHACSIHGRYSDTASRAADADDALQLVLLPGDIAPYVLKLGLHGEYLSREAITWELVAEL
ncbi:DUF3396 domain-containing protein [Massilia forsythiae]|uniref:DUF3396 domain-containing protein n=1 Tax=Massilia forsythiae TaxID=2728020 RepID=A0A7Z2VZ30_9BURK|nr:type VI immunity family protein [Massilia forsythiae]QJE02027.1 DUF3396 domain-containing protein [Massilia forsythiae]